MMIPKSSFIVLLVIEISFSIVVDVDDPCTATRIIFVTDMSAVDSLCTEVLHFESTLSRSRAMFAGRHRCHAQVDCRLHRDARFIYRVLVAAKCEDMSHSVVVSQCTPLVLKILGVVC